MEGKCELGVALLLAFTAGKMRCCALNCGSDRDLLQEDGDYWATFRFILSNGR